MVSVKSKKSAKGNKGNKGKGGKKKGTKSDISTEYGIKKSRDVPWNDTKVKVFKALKALGAKNALKAATTRQVAEKGDVTDRNVRHYCYHARVSGLVEIAQLDGERAFAFYLTAKGLKVNPDKDLKAQTA